MNKMDLSPYSFKTKQNEAKTFVFAYGLSLYICFSSHMQCEEENI